MRAKAAKYFDDVLANPQAFGVAISESIALGDWRLFFLQRDRYRTVTPADVQRVALDYLKRSNLTIGEFLPDAKPDRAPVPPAVDVARAGQGLQGRRRVRRRRGVRPVARQSRRAHAARHACRTA